jgi:hypothetical protein
MVEQVTGRMTVFRAALAGVLVGAAFGAVFGAFAQAMRGGERDFSSLRSLQTGQCAVMVDADQADQARQLLSEQGPVHRG